MSEKIMMKIMFDGTYFRILRKVFGVSWEEHNTNKEIYRIL